MKHSDMERINVLFPRELLDDLRRNVPARQRSQLIVRATEHELRRVKLLSALARLESEPAWKAENHGDSRNGAEAERAATDSRAVWVVAPQE